MAKRVFHFCLIVFFVFLCFPSASAPAQQPAEGRVVGGYFEEWDVRYSGYTMATLEKSGVAAKLTHLIYAFGDVTPGPSPICAIDDPKAAWQDASILGVDGKPFSGPVRGNFAGILELKSLHPRLRTLISLGGQAGDVSGFTAAAASPVARRALVASCISLFVQGHLAPGVEAPGLFDGFNIDWEFPLAADRDNFTALLHEFRAQLDALGRSTGRPYILTFDSPSNPQKYANIDLKAAADEVDFLTIDGYDYATPGEKSTNAGSALYNNPADPLHNQARAIDDTVQAYLKAGVPAAKYTMGMPLYGVGWSGVPKRDHACIRARRAPPRFFWPMAVARVPRRAKRTRRRAATPSSPRGMSPMRHCARSCIVPMPASGMTPGAAMPPSTFRPAALSIPLTICVRSPQKPLTSAGTTSKEPTSGHSTMRTPLPPSPRPSPPDWNDMNLPRGRTVKRR